MITLHQLEPSPFCDKVRRVLRYKGVGFDIVEYPVLGLSKISPNTGKVPVLEVDQQRLEDSTRIALWLDEQYPERPLIPRQPRERALCMALEDWADESLYFYEIALHFRFVDNAPARTRTLIELEAPWVRPVGTLLMSRHMKQLLHAQGTGRRSLDGLLDEVERHFKTASDLLGDADWLVGDQMTLADIAVFVQFDLMWATPQGRELRGRHPRLAPWADRVRAATGGHHSGVHRDGPRERGRATVPAPQAQ